MKKLNKIFASVICAAAMVLGFSACDEADSDYVHDSNLLKDIRVMMNKGAQGIPATIIEYDAKGEVVPAGEVTVESVAGGHGVAVFELDPLLKDDYDLENCYLSASLTFDQIIEPGLAGRKNIVNRNAEGVAQGIEISVRPGTGAPRKYTVIGYFEGEYQLNKE